MAGWPLPDLNSASLLLACGHLKSNLWVCNPLIVFFIIFPRPAENLASRCFRERVTLNVFHKYNGKDAKLSEGILELSDWLSAVNTKKGPIHWDQWNVSREARPPARPVTCSPRARQPSWLPGLLVFTTCEWM